MRQINKQLPSMLEAMASAIKSGYTLRSSLHFVVQEMDDPLKRFLEGPIDKLKLNISFDEVLDSIQDSFSLDDMALFINAVKMQQQVGGNLVEILNQVSESIRERLKIENDTASYTSQGKFSGIILVALGPSSLLLFKFISPEYINPFFETKIGNILLVLALLLDAIGFLWIRKIVQIKI